MFAEITGTTPTYHLFGLNLAASGNIVLDTPIAPAGFDWRIQQERAALSLGNGYVYVPFGGRLGDCGSYNGWVVGVPTSGSATLNVYKTADLGSGLWGAGGVVIDDATGNVFGATGNGVAGGCATTGQLVGTAQLPVELYHQGPGHIFVELASSEAVAALTPDFHALARLTSAGAACFARDGKRWKVRDFLPAIGIEEDPATGSAAGPLALHLARHGRVAFGEEIEISQGSEIGRPSTLYAVAHSPAHVEVGGSAVIVARGEFQL